MLLESRTNGSGYGGVALFLNEAIIYNFVFKSYPINDKLMEALFIQATVAGKSIIIGSIYKPPNVDLPSFIHSFIHSGHFYSAHSSPLLLRGYEALRTAARILYRS